MKCNECKGQLLKGQKFCGACGTEAVVEETMTKCASCEGMFIKGQKFCGDCGSQAATTEQDVAATLDDLGAFMKAKVNIEEELRTLPEVDPDEVDDAPTTAVLLKATIPADGDQPERVDGGVVVEAMLKSLGVTDRRMVDGFTHMVRFMGHLADGDGRILKGVLAVHSRIGALEAGMETLLKSSRTGGRKADLTIAARPPVGGEQRAEPEGDGADIVDPLPGVQDIPGDDLLAKALVMTETNPDALSAHEFGNLETLCNGGFTLKAVMLEDSILGARLVAGLRTKGMLAEATSH